MTNTTNTQGTLEQGFAALRKGSSAEGLMDHGFSPRTAKFLARGYAILEETNGLDLPVRYTFETRVKDGMVSARMLDGSWAVIVNGKVACFGSTNDEVIAEYAEIRTAKNYIAKSTTYTPEAEAKRLANCERVVAEGKVTKGMRSAGRKAVVSNARHAANVAKVLGTEVVAS